MDSQIEELVSQVLDYHWPGYSGNTEKDGDEYVVVLVPLASENDKEVDLNDLPTGRSKVSWKEAIENLADQYPPFTPLDEIDGKFDLLLCK